MNVNHENSYSCLDFSKQIVRIVKSVYAKMLDVVLSSDDAHIGDDGGDSSDNCQ